MAITSAIYKIKISEAYARVNWCTRYFGESGQHTLNRHKKFSDLRWWRKKGYLYFRNEADYLLYCLRWS